MAVVNESIDQHATNGNAEIHRLEALVGDLQAECSKLREELAKAQLERDAYRHLFLNEARERREFEDLDYDDVLKMSAGPVEKL